MNTQKMRMASLVLAMGLSGAAQAATYSVTNLGTLSGNITYATSINDNGQIAGYSSGYSSAGYQVFNAFLYSGDSMTGLGLSDSRAFGINNSGQVVGHSGGQAFLYSGGNVTYLGGGLAYDINDDGQVVGYAITSGNPAPQQAFLYSGGGMSILGGGSSYSNAFGINDSGQIVGDTDSTAIAYNDPGLFGSMLYVGGGYTGGGGVTLSAAHAINNSGQIAGNYSTSIPDGQNNSTQVTRALFFDGSSTIDLGAQSSVYYDPLGGMHYNIPGSYAQGINDSGQVVGQSEGRAFLYSNGVMTDLNSLIDPSSGWIILDAQDINESGQIAANGYNTITNEGGALLLTLVPVPEPETYAMMLAGLGLVGFAAGRRTSVKNE